VTRYSVIIELSSPTALEIAAKLQSAFGDEAARSAKIVPSAQVDLLRDWCDNIGHFGCVHWTTDDIISRFEELGVRVTQNRLQEVKIRIRHIDDGMTELGWEVIESAIRDAVSLEPMTQEK
jgi:hypothetical protein